MQRTNVHITGQSSGAGERLRAGLLLKLLAILVFPAAVLLAALLERSWLLVAALALGMLIVGQIERFRVARATGVALQAGPQSFLAGFVWRAGLLSGLFIVLLGILALFRDTALAREFGLTDSVIALGAMSIAYAANLVGGRLASDGLATSFGAFRSSFETTRETTRTYEGDIIEGEVVDPANDNNG